MPWAPATMGRPSEHRQSSGVAWGNCHKISGRLAVAGAFNENSICPVTTKQICLVQKMTDTADAPVRDKHSGRFVKGHRQLGHRGQGTLNRLTTDIKHGMIHSAVAHGRDGRGDGGLDGFFEWLLKNDLRAWCGIFGRLVPLQVNGEVAHRHQQVQVNLVTVPADMYINADGRLVPSDEIVVDDARLLTLDNGYDGPPAA
jgi:hypothetical protein